MLHTFVPTDRAHALVAGSGLPARAEGLALFADIAGFTPLCESLAAAHGTQRGSEVLATTIEGVFGAIGEAVHAHGGSVVAFAGDALTCWFAGDAADHAVAAALEMQLVMSTSGAVTVPGGGVIELGLKVGVAAGTCTRVLAGDPGVQQFDVASGEAIDRCAAAEKVAVRGEVVVDARVMAALGGRLRIVEHRDGHAVVAALDVVPDAVPWPRLDERDFPADELSRWVQATVFERLTASDEPLLAEFRPVAPVFLGVNGIDHDRPEDVAELDRVVRHTQTTVTLHGGVLLSVLAGDKGTYLVMVFGAPVNHGDERRRAVAAAQELRAAFGDRVRIGVHAGRVFAGLFRGTVFSTYSFLGDVANTAARLMGAARPGQVLIGAPAARELDRRFQLDPLEPLQLKGLDAPVAVSELLPTAATSQALSEPRYVLPLVGRERERRTIKDALDRARTGRGEILSIVADPGMGKSRLLTAAIGHAVRRGFAVLAGECQPHGTASPYLPWQPILHELLGLPFGAPDEVRAEALQAALATGAPQAVPLAPLLGEALDLDLPDTAVTREMPTSVRRQVRHDVLAGVLQARAAAGPLCIVIEDLHWIDSSSRALLQDLAPVLAGLPVLVLAALRPLELDDRVELPDGEVVELDELPSNAAERMAVQLLEHLGEGPADPDDVRAVLERAGGNPFFIEELAREVSMGSTTELPTSIEELIVHRIDQLTERRQRTLRMASIIGRRFATDVLRGAFADTLEPGELPADLDRLQESGLVLVDTPEPDEAYLFRHALVRDVAYETLSYGLRERMHEQVAAFFEASAENPGVELLAFHYARTANTAKEGHYRRLAAERAIRAGAFADAREHLDRALEILAAQDQTPTTLAEELELQLLRGTALVAFKGYGDDEAAAAYRRAHELAATQTAAPELFPVLFGLVAYSTARGDFVTARAAADQLLSSADASGDSGLRIEAEFCLGILDVYTGHFEDAIERLGDGIARYDPARHHELAFSYVFDPGVACLRSIGIPLTLVGRHDEARRAADDAIALSERLEHPFSHASAFVFSAIVAALQGDRERAAADASSAVDLADRAGYPFWSLSGRILLGWARKDCLDEARTAVARYRETGSRVFVPLWLTLLGDAERRAGNLDDARRLLDEAATAAAETGEVCWDAVREELR